MFLVIWVLAGISSLNEFSGLDCLGFDFVLQLFGVGLPVSDIFGLRFLKCALLALRCWVWVWHEAGSC